MLASLTRFNITSCEFSVIVVLSSNNYILYIYFVVSDVNVSSVFLVVLMLVMRISVLCT